MQCTSRSVQETLTRKPSWIRMQPLRGEAYLKLRQNLRMHTLHTVCQEAKCPNLNECWSSGTATIMILGKVCTRGCRFCSVQSGKPNGVVDTEEPRRVAMQIAQTNLQYIVITCVDRDDLKDGGAGIFARTIKSVREYSPHVRIETLISDYAGSAEALNTVLDAHPDVLAHNLETVRTLTPRVRDPRASYDQSLTLLSRVKKRYPHAITKTSLMVGLGETMEQLHEAIRDIKSVGVDILTVGQYLRPTKRHLPVEKYYTPEAFKDIAKFARKTGFLYVASGPLVRSSYKAAELFLLGHLRRLH